MSFFDYLFIFSILNFIKFNNIKIMDTNCFVKNKRNSFNIINNLLGRELGTHSNQLGILSTFRESSNKNELTLNNHLKRIYLCFKPNYTILNVKTPNCYFKHFSPDGTRLIAFNQNLDGIKIYFFNGSSSGIKHLESFNTKKFCDKTDFECNESYTFRMRAFDIYYKEIGSITLTDNNEIMNRECGLFYKNSFMIVASSCTISDDYLPHYNGLASNNESIHIGSTYNYTIYLVDIKNSKVCDKVKLKADKLNLTHNHSIGLFQNVFIVLSLQNQTIHVYNLVPSLDEKMSYIFVFIKSIGRFCFNDDQDIIKIPSTNYYPAKKVTRNRFLNNIQIKGFNELCLTSMKQRILTFVYKKCCRNNSLEEFYSSINGLLSLRMQKMQLLDEEHILIKYVNSDILSSQKVTSENFNQSISENNIYLASYSTQNIPKSNQFYFVLYNMKTATVLNIIKNTSNKLLKIIDNFQDYFTLASLDKMYSLNSDSTLYGNSLNFHTLSSNNIYSKESTLKNISKFVLSQVPISSQSFVSTPYLDHSLFSYDEKLISNLELPKVISDKIIRFNDRETGRFSFRFYLGKHNSNDQQFNSFKTLNTFIWHPTQPFCISIQRNSHDYNINFHVFCKIIN